MNRIKTEKQQRIDRRLTTPNFVRFILIFFGSSGRNRKRFIHKVNRIALGPVVEEDETERQPQAQFI